jgi:hypothetical protein
MIVTGRNIFPGNQFPLERNNVIPADFYIGKVQEILARRKLLSSERF